MLEQQSLNNQQLIISVFISSIGRIDKFSHHISLTGWGGRERRKEVPPNLAHFPIYLLTAIAGNGLWSGETWNHLPHACQRSVCVLCVCVSHTGDILSYYLEKSVIIIELDTLRHIKPVFGISVSTNLTLSLLLPFMFLDMLQSHPKRYPNLDRVNEQAVTFQCLSYSLVVS